MVGLGSSRCHAILADSMMAANQFNPINESSGSSR